MAIKENPTVHRRNKHYEAANGQERFNDWWAFASSNQLYQTEYLLPTAHLNTDIKPFTYEAEVTVTKSAEQLKAEIEKLAPWAYQMEFKGSNVTTLGRRDDREWRYHRYRGSLLVRNVKDLLGPSFTQLSVLDVACHCGPFSLEFAYLGSPRVVGIDLRPENIRQAQWLASVYGISNVMFLCDNVRNLDRYRGFDIGFCGGLFYHLTFPLEFLKNLHDCCDDFVVFDSLSHREPFSGFHLVMNKDVNYSAEGETSYELHPTYRAIVDCLMTVGFADVIELVGSDGKDVWAYGDGVTRSFLAFKKGSKSLPTIRARLAISAP